MSDRKDAAYRTIEGTARSAWRAVSPHLPERVSEALRTPGKAAFTRGDRTGGPALHKSRPHLAQIPTGAVYLVEGSRRRSVVEPAARATLARALGPAASVTDGQLDVLAHGSTAVVSVSEPEISGLIECAPDPATIAVGGAIRGIDGRGRRLHALMVGPPGGRGADPYRGIGALDRLALARQRGTTHFLLPASREGWLRTFPDLADHLARRATIVATSAAGTLWRLAPPPPAGMPKVFGIGLNKTGTTTLHLACTELGLRSYHWGDRAAYHAVLEAQRDGERLMHHAGEQYDVYCDIETLSVRFDLADVQYPGSRFVLTVRDVDAWVDSRKRHAERNARNIERGTYFGSNTRVDVDLWREQWETHIQRVASYFADRDDLLVFDIAAGDGWSKLAPFLGRAVPDTPFPKGNVDRRTRTKPSHPGAPKASPRPPTASRTAQRRKPAPKSRVERSTARMWRSVRGMLPERVAEAIRKPSKRVVRKLAAAARAARSRVKGA